MSDPCIWFPFYIGDYRRDTSRLSTLEHGAYMLLLMDYYATQTPLPDDDEVLARIALVSPSDWQAIRLKIARLFQIEDGEWRHKRIDAELLRMRKRRKAFSDAAKRTNESRWRGSTGGSPAGSPSDSPSDSIVTVITYKEKKKSIVAQERDPVPLADKSSDPDRRNGQAVHPPPQSPTATPPARVNGNGRLSAYYGAAGEVIDWVNDRANRAYPKTEPNLQLIAARLAEGATLTQCKQVVVRKCREWAGDPKMARYLRPKTLFNRTNFAQYVGELVIPREAEHEH